MEQEEILAYHLERAYRLHEELGPLNDASRELAERAAMHYAACGRRASERSDEAAAAALFRHAADLLPEGHEDRPGCCTRSATPLGTPSRRRGRSPRRRASPSGRGRGMANLAGMDGQDRPEPRPHVDGSPRQVDERAPRTELGQALDVFEGLGDERGLATAWGALADVEWLPCRFDVARGAAERAAEHARRTGERELLARALVVRAAAELHGSARSEEAQRSLDEMLSEIGREGLFGQVALVHEGLFTAMRGDFARARQLSDEAIAIAERLGVSFFVAAAQGFRGHVEMLAGNPAAAEPALRREYEIHERLGDEGHRSTSAANLAVALCRLGDWTRLSSSPRSRSIWPPPTTSYRRSSR